MPHDDEATFRLIRTAHTLGLLPDRVAGPARARRQVRPRDLPRPRHRHLAVPSRPGEVRHGHPVPAGPAGLGRARLPASPAGARARRDRRRRRLPRAGAADHRRDDRLRAGPGRRGPADPRQPARASPRSRRGSGRSRWRRASTPPTVDRVWEVLKAFASFGFCKAHAAAFALPTYQSAWLKAHHPAAFLAGVLTHDPGMYPKRLILDDARNLGIAVLAARRQPLRGDLPGREGDVVGRAAAAGARPGRRPARRTPESRRRGPAPPRPARRAALRHPARARRRQGHHRRRGRADRRRPALPLARRLLAPRRGVPSGRRAARRSPARSTPSTGSGSPVPGPAARPGHPARPAAPGRRARPLDPGRHPRAHPRGGAGRPGPHRRRGGHGQAGGLRRSPAPRRPGGSRRTPSAPRPPASRRPPGAALPARLQPVQLALDLGDAPDETVPSGLPEMTAAERVRAELEVLGLDASRHVLDFYEPVARRARRHPLARPAAAAAAGPSCSSPASRWRPRPRRSGPAAGSSSSPSTTPPARSTRRSSRTSRAPTPPRSSTPGCSWSAGCCAGPVRAGSRLRATGAWELPVLLGRVDRRRHGRGPRAARQRAGVDRGDARGRSAEPPRAGPPARCSPGRPSPISAAASTRRTTGRRRRPPAASRSVTANRRAPGADVPAAWGAARCTGGRSRLRDGVPPVAVRRRGDAGRPHPRHPPDDRRRTLGPCRPA